jgi:hypothetical protein
MSTGSTKIFSRAFVKPIVVILVLLVVFLLFRKIFLVIDNYLGTPDVNSLDPVFNDADKFIKYGYPEIKSLAIQFLTLLTAILVFSLTFSEKIVNYNQSKNSVRAILIAGWTLLILAIIADGIGLGYNALALPTALADLNYFEKNQSRSSAFYEPAFISLKAMLISGVFFIGGLVCIVLAGIASLISQARLKTQARTANSGFASAGGDE